MYSAKSFHPTGATLAVTGGCDPERATCIHIGCWKTQHGFRYKLSTEIQLIEFTKDMLRGMKDGKQSDVVVMNFAKAFDKVSDTRLFHKYKCME